MRYNGGKQRIARKLAAIIQQTSPKVYWEPFCGMASVALHIQAPIKYVSDADAAVIAVLQAAIEGFQFPSTFSEEEYQAARHLPASNPLHGFAKYGCSFAGKPWGGYARSSGRNYAANASSSLRRYCGRYDLTCLLGDYRTLSLEHPPDVIYCDPPYLGTTSVGASSKFDTEAFWSWAELRLTTAEVFVSEYQAPKGWQELFAEPITDGLVPRNRQNVERLFRRVL